MTAAAGFWDWSAALYARAGVAPLLLRLQDEHGLNVNLVLWTLWCGERFQAVDDLAVRKAVDLARQWSTAVTAPLRNVRRHLKTPPREISAQGAAALRDRVKDAELAAERLEQEMLEALAATVLKPAENAADAESRARRGLAAYVRLTDASRRPGFSVSLLEELIGLTFQRSDEDHQRMNG